MSLHIHNLSKKFGRFPALQKASLEIATGELLALLGPSGSGKTTLLRLIAGLEFPDAGQILFHGNEVTHKNAYERKAGFVFQSYALFNHMSVFENVAFGLRVKPSSERPAGSEIERRVNELLTMVQLEHLAHRFPSQLSGGQRQRVAFARALAIEPRVLLLDEPFAALDSKVRRQLRKWLRQFHEETKLTTLFVTHDQEEAFELADHVVILNHGKVEQAGTPDQIRSQPANAFVEEFIAPVDAQISATA